MFISPGFVLVPMYIYPTSTSTWAPLTSAAARYPNLDFLAVVNPNSGPDGKCPDSSYAAALDALNGHSNIQTLGYVHSSYAATAASVVQAAIDQYQNWPTCSTTLDLHLGGIFFDETPTSAAKAAYMAGLGAYAKKTMTHGNNTVLFNTGAAPESSAYWAAADYINSAEISDAQYAAADLGSMDAAGAHRRQATMILHDYDEPDTILHVKNVMATHAWAGLYITELKDATSAQPDNNPYAAFPKLWSRFCQNMNSVLATTTITTTASSSSS